VATKKNFKTTKFDHSELYKKIFTRIGLILLILALLYFCIFNIFSNIDNFWKLIPGNKNQAIATQKEIPLQKPYINNLPDSYNKEKIDIQGITIPNVKVKLFLNSQSIEDTLSDSTGSFNFGQITIQPGINSFYVIVEDNKGKKSDKSNIEEIKFDKEKPPLNIDTPKNGETYKARVRTLKVEGKTELEATVRVNGILASIDFEGRFFTTISPEAGNNEVIIIATDRAGNETKEIVNYSFEEE